MLACRAAQGAESLEEEAAKRGLQPLTRFHLNRYLRPGEVLADVRRLRAFAREEGVDLLHTHRTHDHLVGGLAVRRGRYPIPVVRTNHRGIPLRSSFANRALLPRWTDGLIAFSKASLEQDRVVLRVPADRALLVQGGIDLLRFDPALTSDDLRQELGIPREAVVIGIVARVQRHRRFHVLLEAMQRVRHQTPEARLLIVGRGTHIRSVAIEPARALGLAEMVDFAGYRKDDYVQALRTFDVGVLLVPGSDGSCRAVREAMAMGIPMVVSRRGALPELVRHGVDGLVVDDAPETLADALLQLVRSPELRRQYGRAARERARDAFSYENLAARVEELYRRVLAAKE